MTRPSPRLAFLVVVLLLSATLAVAPIAASSSYDASVAGSIDVPDRTIEVERSGFRIDFDITSIARVEPGEKIDVDTTGPENETYYVEKFNSDGDRLVSTRVTGDNSTKFLTANDDPGTYLVAIRIDGYDFADRAVPVVVAAYDANLTVPEEAAPGETVTATVELEPYDQEPTVDSVELTLMNGSDGEPERIAATPTGGGDHVYEAEITVPETEGEYNVFSAVFGEDSLTEDEQEMLEITETSIEVSEAAADGGADGGSADGGDGSGDSDNNTGDTSDSNDDGSGTDGSDDDTADGSDSGEENSSTDETKPDGNGTDTLDGNGTDENSTDALGGNETDGNGTDTDGSSDSGSSSDGADDSSSDSSESASDGGDSIDPNDTDDIVSEEQAPLTGIPQFLAALLTIGLLSHTRSRD